METRKPNSPTYAQLDTLFRWFVWQMPRSEASAAVDYLKHNATRDQVSEEIGRIYPLFKNHTLNKQRCFEADIWRDFHYE